MRRICPCRSGVSRDRRSDATTRTTRQSERGRGSRRSYREGFAARKPRHQGVGAAQAARGEAMSSPARRGNRNEVVARAAPPRTGSAASRPAQPGVGAAQAATGEAMDPTRTMRQPDLGRGSRRSCKGRFRRKQTRVAKGRSGASRDRRSDGPDPHDAATGTRSRLAPLLQGKVSPQETRPQPKRASIASTMARRRSRKSQ